jgi:hypothetical protein
VCLLVVVVVVVCRRSTAVLELFDLDGDVFLPLGVGESDGAVLLGLGLPVLGLVGGLEGGVFADGGVAGDVDVLDVL